MMNLLAIITVLVLALVVLVPFMEKHAKKGEPRDYGNLTRFLFPLMGVLIVLQLIRYYFF